MRDLDAFNITDNFTYLNNASIGLLPRKTLEILEEKNRKQSWLGEAGLDRDEILQNWDYLQKNIAQIIGGKAEGVTFTTNTASGLHLSADGIQESLKSNQSIVIPDIEFSTNSYIWQKLVKRKKMKLETIAYSQGEYRLEDWEEIINSSTAIVALSSIQYSNGLQSDIKGICNLAHDHGAKVVVDGIQHIGNTPFKAEEWGVDFIAAGGYKWQLAPIGTGFFYINPNLIEDFETILIGWQAREDGMRYMTHNDFVPNHGARRYQQSLDPKLSAYTSSLDTLLEIGIEKINKHITYLLDYLIQGLPDHVVLMSNREEQYRGAAIKLGVENAEQRVEELKRQNIIVSYRDNAIRISPHLYNTKEDMDRLLDFV
ncbi:MAG: aminotransferase class V-fold PLP-dependent enzyme [Candidatus Heimdallarchaeota archaeon]|nr:aminotransferase class V-fold PLP-dependent enzyme [Candidatus Heimdallarchaeota archaeon]